MNAKLGIALACALAMLTVILVSEQGHSLANDLQASDGKSEAAIRAAYAVTGLAPNSGAVVSAAKETLSDGDGVPFINLAGREVYRVVIGNVRVRVTHPREGNTFTKPWHTEECGVTLVNGKIDTLEVLMDADTLQAIRIRTIVPKDLVEQDKALRERESSRTRDEKSLEMQRIDVTQLPVAPPRITFMQALQAAEEGLGGVTIAPQIEAICVQSGRKRYMEMPDGPPQAVETPPADRWFITLKFMPAAPPRAPMGAPVIAEEKPGDGVYSVVTHEIDATSGAWIGAHERRQ